MDYYEELGLTQSATPEEIRRAYKSLVRLLHPDQHQDPTLRCLAECQMKRLNEIVAVLTDPERRKAYEANLNLEVREAPERLGWLRFAGRHWIWGLLGALGLGGLLWYFGREAGGQRVVRPAPPAASSPQRPKLEPAPPPRPDRPRVREAPNLRRRPEPPPGETPAPEHPAGNPPSSLDPPPRPKEISVLPIVPVQAAPAPAAGFAGSWFYSRRQLDLAPDNLYPAEYIELVVTEAAGTLAGRYRARYRVPDRPISPEVAFQFAAQASQDTAQLLWTGSGVKGEGRMKLLSPDSLEVTWWATHLGRNLGLASGTAVLTRRKE
jgi:hypothetical protein